MPPHPQLAFCPYLPLTSAIEFAGWKVGPVSAFDNAWGDEKFRAQSTAFLAKFVDAHGNRIGHPALIGRAGEKLDGQMPAPEEIAALQAALDFGLLERNPRYSENVPAPTWTIVTSDNTEVFIWPIDVEDGHVTVTTGGIVRTMSGGFQIHDDEFQIRSPLELHLPASVSADVERLEAVYNICLGAARSPGSNPLADRLHTAIRWFAKSWRNTTSIGFEDRLVFLKTAFESLTGTSNNRESARWLKVLFESLPDTDPDDVEELLWSPAERPIHVRTYHDRRTDQHVTEQLTDLEHWFMAFARARNSIIHDGLMPRPLAYAEAGSAYEGPFFHTAEFLLRAAVKASLTALGYPEIWRSNTRRAVRRAVEDAKQE